MDDCYYITAASATKVAFTAEEKELLVSLLKNEKIIEDKRTNKSTNKLKAEAWARIAKKFNSYAFVTKREIIQLRRCWEKIKKMAKDARATEKKIRMATGGGSPPLPPSNIVPGVDEVAPHLMYEIPSAIDSDSNFKHDRKTETNTAAAVDPEVLYFLNTTDSESCSRNIATGKSVSENTPVTDVDPEFDPNVTMHTVTELIESSPQQPQVARQSTPISSAKPALLSNRNLLGRSRLAPATASDVLSMRKNNILKEREHEEELYLLRRSILLTEQDQAKENLRHQKAINKIKETLEEEKLEHQRVLWRLELDRLN